jgi:preprotein translocase subunit YajC
MQIRYFFGLLPIHAMAHGQHTVTQIDINDLISPPMLLLFLAVIYCLMIRPQMKSNREHEALLAGLQVGDDIKLTSGIIGTITKITEDYVCLQTNVSSHLYVDKHAIQQVLPDQTVRDQSS